MLNKNLKQNAQKPSLRSNSIFQQSNNLKQTAEIVKLRLLFKYKMRLRTPPQSPDLNVIENLRSKLEISAQKHSIKNKEHLKTVLQEEWGASFFIIKTGSDFTHFSSISCGNNALQCK
ncbi:hypothetical protein AVEN_231799-1 [Araneus ventricosus]|nr:hypothetical protein AVEN_191428-1 [Araneus ventricosus]GBN92780.1 hypothetical protein AVEN_231799-1 [Araneus ventricosus]